MSVSFKYRLTGSGWSSCQLEIDDQRALLTASYLTDALRSLVSAVCRVMEGQPDATASFSEEPGEYRWRLYRTDDDILHVVILQLDELWSNKPDSDGRLILDACCRLHTFAGAVYSECKDLLAELGAEGYKDTWVNHRFPTAEVDRLHALLRRK